MTMKQPQQIEQIFIPGQGWQDVKVQTLSELKRKPWFSRATHVRLVGRGDYSVKEIGGVVG